MTQLTIVFLNNDYGNGALNQNDINTLHIQIKDKGE